MTNKKDTNDKVWEEIQTKADEIITKIVEKKKRQSKIKKQAPVIEAK